MKQKDYDFGCVDECDEDLAGQLAGARECPRGSTGLVACHADTDAFGQNICDEVCGDGVDNDGDNEIDEMAPPEGTLCDTGGGGACGLGTIECVLGNAVCVGSNLPAGLDMCGGGDEDCDGVYDEDDLNPQAGAPHPGIPRTGDVCPDSGFPGICQPGTYSCDPIANDDKDRELNCIANIQPGTVAETCDGEDDDCDGTPDNGIPPNGPCNVVDGNGVPLKGECAFGLLECEGGGYQCVQQKFSTAEACDTLDNDCDGLPDDDKVCERTIPWTDQLVTPLLIGDDQNWNDDVVQTTVTVKSETRNNGTQLAIIYCVHMVNANSEYDNEAGEACEEVVHNLQHTIAAVATTQAIVEYFDDTPSTTPDIVVLNGARVQASENTTLTDFVTDLTCISETGTGDDLAPPEGCGAGDVCSHCYMSGSVTYTIQPTAP